MGPANSLGDKNGNNNNNLPYCLTGSGVTLSRQTSTVRVLCSVTARAMVHGDSARRTGEFASGS